MTRSDQFFHGTRYHIPDKVRPVNDLGDDRHVSEYSMGDPGDLSQGDHAFAIRNDEGYAWQAAHIFHNNGRRPRVYEVDPAPDMKPGPWNVEHPDFLAHHELDDPAHYTEPPKDSDDHRAWKFMVEDAEHAKATRNQDEWASPTGFNVRKRIDIMPGRQGTFPEFNWNRFKEGGVRTSPNLEANHPTDDQVKYGMRGLPRDPRDAGPEIKHTKQLAGRSLRAFLQGKPDPDALENHPRLF